MCNLDFSVWCGFGIIRIFGCFGGCFALSFAYVVVLGLLLVCVSGVYGWNVCNVTVGFQLGCVVVFGVSSGLCLCFRLA